MFLQIKRYEYNTTNPPEFLRNVNITQKFIHYKRLPIHLFLVFILMLLSSVPLTAENAQDEQSTLIPDKPSVDISSKWYSNIFTSAGFQTFIPGSLLKDYTKPKPGYRIALGYTFFRSKQHTLPVYLETGHGVILGTNPLVRSFDAVPITINAAYEYFPIRYLSVGAFAGIGLYALQIQHYPVVLDILTNKLKTSHGVDGVLNMGIA